MIVYIDTEFTDLSDAFGPIKLISAGFVAEDGREFYFELTDNYQENDCSDFVLDNVLPHLDNQKHGMTSKETAYKIREFIEGFWEPVTLASDAPAYDNMLIGELMRAHGLLVENFDPKDLYLNKYVIQERIEKYFEYQPMAIRHHAMWDARALASAAKGGVN